MFPSPLPWRSPARPENSDERRRSAASSMRGIYEGVDDGIFPRKSRDEDGDDDGDEACAECALPCLFLLGPAAVFLVLGLGALHGWSHETGSTRDAALVELRSAVGG